MNNCYACPFVNGKNIDKCTDCFIKMWSKLEKRFPNIFKRVEYEGT